MICTTFLLACAICLVGMAATAGLLGWANQRGSKSLTIVSMVLLAATLAGTLGVCMVQKKETDRASRYAYQWQRKLFAAVSQCETKEDTIPVVEAAEKEYREGYQALGIRDSRVAPKHRRDTAEVTIRSDEWKAGETVVVVIKYNELAKPGQYKVVLGENGK